MGDPTFRLAIHPDGQRSAESDRGEHDVVARGVGSDRAGAAGIGDESVDDVAGRGGPFGPIGALEQWVHEDDPNVTNKKFPGNVTQSYRTRDPVRVVDEVRHWEPHPPDVLGAMLDSLARLRELGLDVIED